MNKQNRLFGVLPAVFLVILILLFFIFSDVFSGRDKSRPKITVILKTTERVVDFWVILEQGILQASEDFDVDVKITGPSKEGNIDEQIEILRRETAEKPDIIVLAAADYHRLVEPVRETQQEGIPVLTVDSFISSDDAATRIGTANYEAGSKLADHLRSVLPEGSLIGVLSYVRESSTAIEREKGLRAGIDEKFRVLPTLYNHDDMMQGALDAEILLEEYPDLKAIVALNELTARGLLVALSRTEYDPDLLFLTFDSNMDIIEGLEKGILEATVVQKPYSMGYQAIKTAVEMTEGNTPPKQIDTGSVLVTADNLFEPVIQKLLFPTTGGDS